MMVPAREEMTVPASVGDDESSFLMMRVEPGPTGRVEREVEVLLEGSRTAAMAVTLERARYFARRPRPIPSVHLLARIIKVMLRGQNTSVCAGNENCLVVRHGERFSGEILWNFQNVMLLSKYETGLWLFGSSQD